MQFSCPFCTGPLGRERSPSARSLSWFKARFTQLNQEKHMYMYTQGHSRVVSTGIYLPEEKVSSRQLLESIDSKNRFDVPYDWLDRMMGISERRVAAADMTPSDM